MSCRVGEECCVGVKGECPVEWKCHVGLEGGVSCRVGGECCVGVKGECTVEWKCHVGLEGSVV